MIKCHINFLSLFISHTLTKNTELVKTTSIDPCAFLRFEMKSFRVKISFSTSVANLKLLSATLALSM